MRALAALLALAACADEIIPDPVSDVAEIAEQYCRDHPTWPCGHVYLCKGTPADNKLGFVEVCTLDTNELHAGTLELAEAAFGMCEPTPRHQGLCWWGCAEGWVGANAYNGCFGCPSESVP